MNITNMKPGEALLVGAAGHGLRPRAIADIEDEVNTAMSEIATRSTTTTSAAPELVVGDIDPGKVFARLNRRKAFGAE